MRHFSTTTAALLIILTAVSAVVHADTPCGEPIGEWGYGPTSGATGNGAIAVFGSGRVLQIADITDPGKPAVVGSVTLGDGIWDIAIDDDLAYVAARDAGLAIVDLSRPDQPEIIGRFPVDDGLDRFALQDDRVFLAARGQGLVVLDISDPTTPVEIATLSLDRYVMDVVVVGTNAFVANSSGGLKVVDVANPQNPTVIASLDDVGTVSDVAATAGGEVIAISDRQISVVRLIDVSDPDAPSEMGVIDVDDDIYGLDVDDRFVYVVGQETGVVIVDISDPTAPVEVQTVSSETWTYSVAVHAGVAYIGNYTDGLRLVDVSPPQQAHEIGHIDGMPRLYKPAMDGSLGVLSAGSKLITLDLSVPATPSAIAMVDFPGVSRGAVIDGDLAYVANYGGGLVILDISDPADPVVVAIADTPISFGVTKHDDVLFVALGVNGLLVLDVSSPTDPVVIGSLEGVRAFDSAHVDGVLYVPDYDRGLVLIDVTDPTAPTEIASLDFTKPSGKPVVQGSTLFLNTSLDGVALLDISNPRAPVEIGRIDPTNYTCGPAVAGELLFVPTVYDEGFIYDVSNPADPVLVASPLLASSIQGDVTSQGSMVLLAEGGVGLRLFDLAACSTEPPTADFVWRPGNPKATRPVRLTDTSYGGVTARSWDFGDGATSTDRNPSHAWEEEGTYDVSLTVTGPIGSEKVTKSVTVGPRPAGPPPITAPGDHAWIISAAAHAPGLASTRWVTDIVLHNPGTAPVEAFLWFMKAGQDNTAAETVSVTVAAGASTMIEDAVLSLFDEDDATGAVLVGADSRLLVTSRTYNDAASGTYGQFIPGRETTAGVTRDEAVRLIQLTRTSTFRTNLGVANPTAGALSVVVSLHDAQGAEIGTTTLSVPPFGYLQQTDILGTDVGDAFAVVSSSTMDASYFPYASVVDNRTGDPIMVEPIEPSGLMVIPAAAHVGGLAGTDWRTDLEICNPETISRTAQLRLLVSDQSNSNPVSMDVDLAGGRCRRLADVLDASFSHEGTAALELAVGSGELIASSRTFNTTDGGTYGQFLPGVPTARVVETGHTARIIGLSQDAGNDAGFRTNLGFVNRSATDTTVDVVLGSSHGSVLGSTTIQLRPFEHLQINRIFRTATSVSVSNGTVTVSSANGPFIAYASVVDNASGDPIFVPAMAVGD